MLYLSQESLKLCEYRRVHELAQHHFCHYEPHTSSQHRNNRKILKKKNKIKLQYILNSKQTSISNAYKSPAKFSLKVFFLLISFPKHTSCQMQSSIASSLCCSPECFYSDYCHRNQQHSLKSLPSKRDHQNKHSRSFMP